MQECIGQCHPARSFQASLPMVGKGRGAYCASSTVLPRKNVLKEMEDDVCNLQPESEGFILVEFCSGAHATVFMHVHHSWNASIVVVLCRWTTYLKAEMDDRTEVKVQDLKFFVKGNP